MDTFPLTPTQLGMLADVLRADAPGAYHEQIVVDLDEELEPRLLARAWEHVVQSHGALRTTFVVPDDGAPLQVVHDTVSLDVREVDLRPLEPSQRASHFEALRAEDVARPFDLASVPLARITLARVEQRYWRMLWSFPHLVLDGRSFALVLGDLFRAYDALLDGELPPLIESPSFREFIDWRASRDVAAAGAFWRAALAGVRAPTRLPSTGAGSEPGDMERVLPAGLSSALRREARAAGAGLSTIVYAVWALLLARHASASDVTFGIARAGRRDAPDSAGLVGVALTTVPLRVSIAPNVSVREWLRTVRSTQRALAPHDHPGLAAVQRWSEVPFGTALFESVVVYDEAALDGQVRAQAGRWATRRFALHERTGHPLTFYAYGDPEITLRVAWNAPYASPDGAAQLLDEVAGLFDMIATRPDAGVGTLLPTRSMPSLPQPPRDRSVRA